jgi:hypothetical protein
VDIDKPGRDDPARGFDDRRGGCPIELPDRLDSPSSDPDVRPKAWLTRPVDDKAIPDDDVKHRRLV